MNDTLRTLLLRTRAPWRKDCCVEIKVPRHVSDVVVEDDRRRPRRNPFRINALVRKFPKSVRSAKN